MYMKVRNGKNTLHPIYNIHFKKRNNFKKLHCALYCHHRDNQDIFLHKYEHY